MKKLLIKAPLVVISLLAFNGSTASAFHETVFRARLVAFEEVPAISSRGTGDLRLALAADSGSLSFRLRYADLEGGQILFAHVHLGQRSVNGGVMFFFCGGGGKPACPPAPATVMGTVGPDDIIGPGGQGIDPGEFGEVVRGLRSGNTYANVHTTKYPGGEIRGQVRRVSGDDDE